MTNELELEVAPITTHIDELRRAVTWSLASWLSMLLVTAWFYQPLLQFVLAPYRDAMTQREQSGFVVNNLKIRELKNKSDRSILYPHSGFTLEMGKDAEKREDGYWVPPDSFLVIAENAPPAPILLSPSEGMMTAIKVCCWAAFLLSAPFWSCCLLWFIAPAFPLHRQSQLLGFFCLTLISCALAITIAHQVSLPIANEYLMLFNADIGQDSWQLERYVDYALSLLLAHGGAAIAASMLFFAIHTGFLDTAYLAHYRRHVLVGTFIIGAILTPPDVLTQVLLAIPLYLIFELCLLYGRWRQ